MMRVHHRRVIRVTTHLLLFLLLNGLAGPARRVVIGASVTRAASGIPHKAYSRHPSSAALKWANKELKKMSIDEKIGQLIAVGLNATFLNQDSAAFQDLRHQIVDNHVGGIVLFRGPVYESVMLVNRMQQLAKYPLLISADLEAGPGMRIDDTVNFPWNMAEWRCANPSHRQGHARADLRGSQA